MEISEAKKKMCWKAISGTSAGAFCLADQCMGWEQESKQVTKLINYNEPIPKDWSDRGGQMKGEKQMRLIAQWGKTTCGWCAALPTSVE